MINVHVFYRIIIFVQERRSQTSCTKTMQCIQSLTNYHTKRKRNRMTEGFQSADKFTKLSDSIPAPHNRNNYNISNYNTDDDHIRFAYPGINFSRTKPFTDCGKIAMLDSKIQMQEQQEKEDGSKKSSVRQCSCMRQRSESFYDIFLASSVRESPEYEEYVKNRDLRRLQRHFDNEAIHKKEEDEEMVGEKNNFLIIFYNKH